MSSVCAIPMPMPAISASGKERNPATSAAAVAARMMLVMTVTWSVTIGAIMIAAKPAIAEPSAQLMVATRSGDQPRVEATRSFSATALVAIPKRV